MSSTFPPPDGPVVPTERLPEPPVGGAGDGDLLAGDTALPGTGSDSTTGPSGSDSTREAAADQAKQIGHEAVDSTKQVAGVASEQVQSVASEVGAQARQVVGEARRQLTDQASTQQNNLATWLFSIVDELEQMTDRTKGSGGDQSPSAQSGQAGQATALVRQVSERARGAATWLQDHEPQDLLAETGRFARRRPGLFLAIAVAGGVLAGRLTRGLTADSSDDSDGSRTRLAGSSGSAGVGSLGASYGTAQSVRPQAGYASGYEPEYPLDDEQEYARGTSAEGGFADSVGVTDPVVDPLPGRADAVEEVTVLRPGSRHDADDEYPGVR